MYFSNSYVEMLLGIILLCFVLQLISPEFTELFVFNPYLAISQPWRFITSIFLHGGLMHLFFNGYALFMFGKIVERKIGSSDFLKIFFLAGLAGSILYYITFLLGLTNASALGASGAIFGVLGIAAMLFPGMKLFVFPFPIPISMRTAVIVWIVLEFIGMFNPGSGIASAAHLGGLFIGLVYGAMFKNKIYEEQWWLQ